MVATSETRSRWDFALMVATLALLGGLGTQSLVGTLYVWWAQRAQPGFMQAGYGAYTDTMNAIALPQLVALVGVMGLCVPKRLFERKWLIVVSAVMVLAGIGVGLARRDAQEGLAAYLALASLIQAAVIVFTLAGSPSLRVLHEGRVAKTGSGLLHMGLLLFGLVVLALQGSAWMMPVFGVSTLSIVIGCALAFWPRVFGSEPKAS
ncbi:MAG TPA: hypothetical protein VGK67_36125 [Myxococcales bacterium]|jgi:hypothetical protein